MITFIRQSLCLGAWTIFCFFIANHKASGQCSDQVNFIIVANSSCGGNSGDIIIGMSSPATQYAYNWTPNVSSSNAASALSAGVYSIKISRLDNPSCLIDTIVVVDEVGGPAFSVNTAQSNPADCLASNGKVTLQPNNLNYAWSNGETGFLNEGLPSGRYFVTATIPGNPGACKNIEVVRVNATNSLTASYAIISKPKCGLPNGVIEIFVSGGSGNYSFNGGANPVLSGLSAGNQSITVMDNSTGCNRVLNVFLENLDVSAAVIPTVHPPVCPGSTDGFVEIEVIPGQNFALPYTFSLSSGGNQVSLGNVPPGLYDLLITDATGCSLTPKLIQMAAPPAFQIQSTLQAASCIQDGKIELSISGGTGPYTIDWQDLSGAGQPTNRNNLAPGIYAGILYDSLFCSKNLGPFTINSTCNKADTTHLIVPANTSKTYCLPSPPGANTGAYSLIGSSTSGQSVHGSWTLQAGCLKYQAGPNPGFALDTICIRSFFPAQSFLNDTVCIIVSISAGALSMEQIYVNIPANDTQVRCGQIPVGFSQIQLVPIGISSLEGNDQFGEYDIHPTNACLTYAAGNIIGFNLDTLCVGVYDQAQNQAHIICYILNILPLNSCTANIINTENQDLVTSNCSTPTPVCLNDIPFADLPQYSVLDNGVPYTNGYFPCNLQYITTYKANQIPLGAGPYTLVGWVINGQFFDGQFGTLAGLVALMNQLDPNGHWIIKNNFFIQGGNPNNNYGLLEVKSALGLTGIMTPDNNQSPLGVELRFLPGEHTLVFNQSGTGCSDTLHLNVICLDCPPIFTYPVPPGGTFKWSLGANCDGDTTFCTNIPLSQVNDFSITDQLGVFNQLSNCGNQMGLLLDTGFHQLTLKRNSTNCTYSIKVDLGCAGGNIPEIFANFDEYTIPRVPEFDLDILANDVVFGANGNFQGLNSFELLSNPQLGTAQYLPLTGKLRYYLESGNCGLDTFSYRITDTLGSSSSALIQINVVCEELVIFTGISPNGDGKNDVWHILGIEEYPENEVSVYNRWGNLVFKKKGYNNNQAWDGQWNGKNLPDGVYYYIIELGKGEETRKGALHIVR